jgi:hypothetical protein
MVGDLGPNSQQESLTPEDTFTVFGAGLALNTAREMDNTAADRDPAPGQVRTTEPDSSDQASAEFVFRDRSIMGRMEMTEQGKHLAWMYGSTENLATLVVLEDCGESFLATAFRLDAEEAKSSKTVRSGRWNELPEGISFGMGGIEG